MFGNKSENYILSESYDNQEEMGSTQNSMSWLNNKNIREIICSGPSDFLFICCKEYDRDLDVQSSKF